MKKKRTWKFWLSRSILALLLIGSFWLINLIWFRPFNIKHFYDKIFVQLLLDSPEVTTALGIPVLYDWSKDELDDISDAKQWKDFEQMKETQATLKSYEFDKQSKTNQLNTKILAYFLKGNTDKEPYFYHDYPVNQMFGIQSELPSFLENSHKLKDKSDVEAYISRLSKFETKFDQLLEGLKIREEKGIIPPKFVIKRVVDEMKGFVGHKDEVIENLEDAPIPVKSNILYTNFSDKVADIEGLSAEEKTQYQTQVEEVIQTTVFGAYGKLIQYFENLNDKATTDDGVWKLPDGENFYAYQLRQSTTTDLTPEEVHQIGLQEVARLKAEMWDILEQEGYVDTTQTLGEVIQALSKEERFLYPENDEGRELVLKEYQAIIDEINQGLADAFDIRPKATMEVKRVPEFKEEGSNKAYYYPPAMDNSRGGIFYANLRKVQEHPKFTMKTLAYHEGIPGHHFQIAIQFELTGVPIFRNVLPFTAYDEGWALYTEQLAYELGFYENDPFGNLGRLQAEIWRAVRLVVDTGIHHKKWTREQAIEYMVANTGLTTSEVVTEIERYIVMPGQACAYKIGMMKILELRAKAKKALGNRFDLKEFHNVVLKNGSLPLTILEEVVEEYIGKNS